MVMSSIHARCGGCRTFGCAPIEGPVAISAAVVFAAATRKGFAP